MKTSTTPQQALARKLDEALLLSRRVEGDRLVLADAILLAALDGSRALSAIERAALTQSPLTLRRFRQLSIERAALAPAANDDAWNGSAGMLRAAAGSAPLRELVTDDGHWRLHFIEQDGYWRVILALDAAAPFAARLLRQKVLLRVTDGAGALVLHGQLDSDGECETDWPFASAPAAHFQQAGARFAVEPMVAAAR